ncbi:NAD(P)/FAD-dependent oxidoreductase [Kordiimonas aestuarii]|uniref:NAD(P)/FAD-dependent oxidoreductase n=1 Tax=Kordiimonas aestuarii TaxID=1005925 RepID=UPI0021CF385B|nr:FAD-binding oxidoreductase [Kordiimonas aestuarii]
MHKRYPDSWYAASVPVRDDEPSLTGDADTDVCVIGAGFTGLSAALTLAEAGRTVTVLEAARVGWGASGRNGGQLIRGFVGQERLAKHWGGARAKDVKALTWAGHDLIRRRMDDYSIDCELTPGWLEVAPTPRQLAMLYHSYNEMETAYPDRGWHMVGARELADTMGSDAYQGGLLSMSDGHLHPLKLCLGLYVACKKLGVQFHEHSPVIRIEEGETVTVHTGDGRVRAKHVVLAANAHHKLYPMKLGGLAFPAGSYLIATEPLEKDALDRLNPHRYAICDTKKVCDYFRMSGDGRVLFGGRVNFSGHRPKSIRDKLMPRLLRIWPELEGVKVTHEWGGKLGVALGEVPLVGRVGENVWYSFGYTGHGVNMGNLMGAILGEAISGHMSRFELFAGVPKWRLPIGRCLGRQVVSSAIVYYWLKDRL